MSIQYVLASDIDDTLTGDSAALHSLAGELTRLRDQGALFLILSTGRRLNQVMDGYESEGIPFGDAVVSQVGTEIYLPPYAVGMPPLKEWDELLHADFSREEAVSFLSGVEGLEMQPEKYNTPLKVSCYLDKASEPDAAADEVKKRAAAAGG
ncbi:MAG: HAD family hydrolase, partial [Candidatus Pacebacteria bacterium]|nr:HAD family hydrolase [Candidatus Paceibacterota bacterium]